MKIFTHTYIYRLKDLEAVIPEVQANLLLDEADHAKIASAKSLARKAELRYGRYICKMLFAKYSNADISNLQIGYDEHGKPFFNNRKGMFFFNLSHSSDFLAFCISDAEVGVDIEKPKPSILSSINEIAASHFTPVEMQVIVDADDPHVALEIFYRMWSCKEAGLKAIGTGLLLPMASIDSQKVIAGESFTLDVGKNAYFLMGDYLFLSDIGCHLAVVKCGNFGDKQMVFGRDAIAALGAYSTSLHII